MEGVIFDHLAFLYGAERAREAYPRLAELITQYSPVEAKRIRQKDSLPLCERDALLITYADQVQEPSRAPLQSLGEFLQSHVNGIISGVHILPFYPSSSDDGFAVMDYFAVDPAFGTWEDIQRLGETFTLMFDGVVNHASAQSEWFRRFLQNDPAYQDFFVTVEGDPNLSQVIRPRALPLLTPFAASSGRKLVWTTFSADQVDLNFRNPRVLLAIIEVLLFYVTKGARFIRLDAIAFLWKEIGTCCLHLPQTHRAIQLMRAVLDAVAPQTLLITETNVPHVDNVSYFGDGTNEAQLVYNFALPPLVLHALLTANATALNRWAETLRLPSQGVTWFNFLASHDGIGLNPARGILSETEIEGLVARTLAHGGMVSYKHNPDGTQSPYELNITYFDALSNPGADEPQDLPIKRFLVAQAIMLSLAGLPGIYVHSLFGSRNDRVAAETLGIPRRINRQKFLRTELETQLAQATSLTAQVFQGYRNLLTARQSTPAFHPQSLQQLIPLDPRVFSLLRTSPAAREQVLCLHNLSREQVEIAVPASLLPALRFQDLLTARPYDRSRDSVCAIRLAPYEIAWLRADTPADA